MTADSLHQRDSREPGQPSEVVRITDGVVASHEMGRISSSLEGFSAHCRLCDYTGSPEMLLTLAKNDMRAHLIADHEMDSSDAECWED